MQMINNKLHNMERNIVNKCCGDLEDNKFNAIVHICAESIVKDSPEKIMTTNFKLSSRNHITKKIIKELDWHFDEDKVATEIKNTYASWDDDQIYTEVDKIDDLIEEKCSKQIEFLFKEIIIECRRIVKAFNQKGEFVKCGLEKINNS